LQTKTKIHIWGSKSALLLLIKLKRFRDWFTKSNFYAVFDNGGVVFYLVAKKNLMVAQQRLRTLLMSDVV